MKHTLIPAALALLAIPAIGSAHTATVTCNPSAPGTFVVAADYLQLAPVTTYGPAGATVTWSDGYVVTLPLPSGCVAPMPPVMPDLSPAPPPPDNFAITPPAPPVVTPGGPEPQPRVVLTCAQLVARHAGPKSLRARHCVVYRCPRRAFASYRLALRNERRTGKLCRYRVPVSRRSIPVTG